MQRIAVLTSGGDAPGMNAAVRAVVRAGIAEGFEPWGVRRGYAGLVGDDLVPLGARDVGGIIQAGGTVLGSARCKEFLTDAGRRRALRNLERRGIEAAVIIGGNGSQTGAHELSKLGFPVVGVASTIDNDLCGCDITIGADSALNVALEAIDRLKVTASSHHRAFLVEVMGRNCGYLALMAALAGGAEAVLIPEVESDPESVARELAEAHARGKRHGIIVVAEGARWNADRLAAHFQEHDTGFELRVTKLGHVQRGGEPTAFDRGLATRTGVGAVRALRAGSFGVLVGLLHGEIRTTPLSEVAGRTKAPDPALIEIMPMLSR